MHGTRIIITTVLALTVTISVWADKPKSPTTKPESAATPTSAPAESLAKQLLVPSDTVVLPKALDAKSDELSKLVVRFQFDGIPYMDVIRRFSQAADKPLLGDAKIEGKLTFVDDRPYSYNDALDTLNTILSMKGFALREEGRFLRIRPLSEMPSTAKIFPGLEEATDLNPSEIVTVMIPNKPRSAGFDLSGVEADGFIFRVYRTAGQGQWHYHHRPSGEHSQATGSDRLYGHRNLR